MTRGGNKSDHCAVVDIRRRLQYSAIRKRYPAWSGHGWGETICRRVCGRHVRVLYRVCGSQWLRGEGYPKG